MQEELIYLKNNLSRKCDSKYSNGKCWKDTFAFFTNDFITNTLNFLRTSQILQNHKDGLDVYLRLDCLQKETFFEHFVEPYKESEIVEFSDTMRAVYDTMISNYEEILQKENVQSNKMYKDESLMCPQTKYFQSKNSRLVQSKFQESKLRVLKVLTFFFASATFLLIGVYVFLYLLIEMRLVNTYKNL